MTERFEISGRPIASEELDDLVGLVLEYQQALVHDGDGLGAFEVLFLVALAATWEAWNASNIEAQWQPARAAGARKEGKAKKKNRE